MTKLMIRATWHIVTLSFLLIGSALIVCSQAGPSQSCRTVGQATTVSYASFAGIAIGLAGKQAPRALVRHRGPLIFILIAVLAWRGWASI